MERGVLYLSEPAVRAAWEGVRREAPREAVGLFLGRGELGEEAVFLPNVHPEPELAYRADPAALLRVLREADARELRVVALFHSHPRGLAYPSDRDRREAYWRVPYLIFGLAEGRARAFWLPEGEEVAIEVVTG